MCQTAVDREWCDEGVQLIRVPADEVRRGCGVPIRYVVVLLGLLGCTVDYLVRFGLSIAIVAMVNSTSHNHLPPGQGGCFPNASHQLHLQLADNQVSDAEFDWSVTYQGIILGTFYWGYFITKTTGGRISEVLGARETLAASLALSGVLSMVCPMAAHWHPLALAGVRGLMGLVMGPCFPALYAVLARWAHPDELATMVTVAFSGMSLGSLCAMGASGWVVEVLGWPWVFWGAGLLALVWTPFWLYFARNCPFTHPLVSAQERERLSVIRDVKPRRHVPWSRLLRCWRFYPSILAESATSWVSNITNTQGPTFLSSQLGLSLKKVGMVLTVGQLFNWCFAFVYGCLSDFLTSNSILSKLNTRRLMHSIGMVLVVVGLVGVMWAGCSEWAACVMLLVAMVGTPTTLSSFTLTPMDIAPNYAGTLSGMLGLGNISGFIAPIVTSQILTHSGSWGACMALGASLYLGAGLVYLFTTTTQVQEWNYYEDLPATVPA